MTKTKTTRYDVADHLRTPKEAATYLQACMDEADGDTALIVKAWDDVARSIGPKPLVGAILRAKNKIPSDGIGD